MSEKIVFAAIGNFDGFHLAHQELIKTLSIKAKENNAKAVVISFDPHPLAVLFEKPPLLLSDPGDKEQIMQACFNIDEVIKLSFTKELAVLPPETFVQEILQKQLQVRHVFVGFNFTFGAKGLGNAENIHDTCARFGIEATVLPAFSCEYGVVSSSLVRECLSDGNLAAANKMLGYWYKFSGVTEKGNQYGRMLGFPTANIRISLSRQTPPYGVYAARAELGGKTYDAVANLGVKPTVTSEKLLLLETHLFGITDEDLYGCPITIYLEQFIRPEKKFNSKDELKTAVLENITEAKVILSGKTEKEHLPKINA